MAKKVIKPKKTGMVTRRQKKQLDTAEEVFTPVPDTNVGDIDVPNPPESPTANETPKSSHDPIEEQIDALTEQVRTHAATIEEIGQVNKILEFFNERLDNKKFTEINGDDLTRLMTKLSVLNVNIGVLAAEAVMAANMSYGWKKFAYASEWNATKERLALGAVKNPTINDIESELTVGGWDNFKTEMKQKLNADRLIAINKGIDSVLMALGYRIKLYHQDRVTTSKQAGSSW